MRLYLVWMIYSLLEGSRYHIHSQCWRRLAEDENTLSLEQVKQRDAFRQHQPGLPHHSHSRFTLP